MSEPKNSRAAKRIVSKDDFIVEFKKDAKAFLYKGFGVNLSATGVCFDTLIPFRANEKIRLFIRFSPEFSRAVSVEFEARVQRSQKKSDSNYYQIACHFETAQKESRDLITQFVQWMIERPVSSHSDVSISEGRRAFKRILTQDEFMLEFKGPGRKLYDKGFGCDLSSRGARFTTLVPLKRGEKLPMQISLSPRYPGNHLLKIKAEILRATKKPKSYYYEVACRFEDSQQKSSQAITQFLDWHQSS